MTHPVAPFEFVLTMAQADGAVPEFPSGDAPVSSAGTPATTADGSNQPLGPNQAQGAQRPASLFDSPIMLIMLGFIAFLFISTIFAGRKQKKQRAEMLGGLSKHDRIMTSGGMIGTIVELKDNEMVLRIDDSTGTKVHFAREAVSSIVKQGAGSTD